MKLMPTKIKQNRRALLASEKNSAQMMQHFSMTAQSSSCESVKKIQHRHAGCLKPSSCPADAAWILECRHVELKERYHAYNRLYSSEVPEVCGCHTAFHKFALSRSYAIRPFRSFLSWWACDIKSSLSRSVLSEWNLDFWRKTAHLRGSDFISSLIFFWKPPAEPVSTPHT